MSHEKPVFKKGSVEHLGYVLGKMRSRRRSSEVRTRQLVALNAKIEELELKTRLLADEAGQFGENRQRLDVETG